MLGSVVELVRAVVGIGAGGKSSREALQRHRPFALGQDNVVQGRAIRGQIDILLVRLPGFSDIANEGAQMLGGVLDRGGAIRTAWVVVIEHAKIGARLRP